jgi:ABC-2 type transport system permease protein
MSRYLRLLRIFWGNALQVELEYRAAFWANAALSLFWLTWAALGAAAYFRFAPSVRGWTYNELLVVLGIFFVLNGLRQAVIQPNLAKMTEYVRLGTLDYLLTKPIASQFMVSLRHVGVYNWLDPILGLGLIAVGLVRRGEPVTWRSIATFFLLIAAGALVMYSLALAIQCLAVWTIGGEGLDDVVEGMVEAGRRGLAAGVVASLDLVTAPLHRGFCLRTGGANRPKSPDAVDLDQFDIPAKTLLDLSKPA